MTRKSPSASKEKILGELVLEVRRMSGLAVQISQAVADRVGLAPTDLEYLDVIVMAGTEITPTELMRKTGLTSGAITGVVDRLEAAGFVCRKEDPQDRRRLFVQPRAERLAEIMKYYSSLQKATTALWSSYSLAELQLILKFTRKGCDTSMRELELIRSMPKLTQSGAPHRPFRKETKRKARKTRGSEGS